MHLRRTFLTVAALLSAVATRRASGDDRTTSEIAPRPVHRRELEAPEPASVLPYIGGGIALVGAAGATIFFLDATRARRDGNARYTSDPAFTDDRARFKLECGLGFAFAGVGAIGVGLAVYGWLHHAPRRDALDVGIGALPGGAVVTLAGPL